MQPTLNRSVFPDINDVFEERDPVTTVESLCIKCFKNGTSRIMPVNIPHYDNVVVISFSCPHCGYENNELQDVRIIQQNGVRWKLRVEEAVDLNRQVVKSDYTCVRIPELDFEVPALSQKGEVTTVEGIVARAVDGLSQGQEVRRQQHPDAAAQLDAFLEKLRGLLELKNPWILELEDITGKCHMENPVAPRRDPRCERQDFKRSVAQDHELGMFTQEELTEDSAAAAVSREESSLLSPSHPEECPYEQLVSDEVVQFRTNCPDCGAPAETNMKLTNIPHFKEVVIMSTVCESCGHRTNEVKSGGGVEPQGVRFELRVAGREDFSRDVLKSETCSMEIPELELDVGGHALGGRFSTAEGLLRATADQLAASPAVCGDAPSISQQGLKLFLEKLEEVLQGKRTVTIVLDDPAGNSYVQSLHQDPTVPDDGLKITRYERSFEQNEELGLNDMKTENYEALNNSLQATSL